MGKNYFMRLPERAVDFGPVLSKHFSRAPVLA